MRIKRHHIAGLALTALFGGCIHKGLALTDDPDFIEKSTNKEFVGTLHTYSSPETGAIAVFKDPATGQFSVYEQRFKGVTGEHAIDLLKEAPSIATHSFDRSEGFQQKYSEGCPEKAVGFVMCKNGLWDRLEPVKAYNTISAAIEGFPKTKGDITYTFNAGYDKKAQIPKVYHLSDDKTRLFIDFLDMPKFAPSYFVAADSKWRNTLTHTPNGINQNLAFFKEAEAGLLNQLRPQTAVLSLEH